VEDNLLGHLLKANDPATERAVEDRLATDPSAGRDLARLRSALAPLRLDRDDVDPPADLWVRTLNRVAQHIVATEGPLVRPGDARTDEFLRRAAAVGQPAPRLPAAITPAPPPTESGLPPARRWNVIAVVGLSLSVLALVVPGVMQVRSMSQRMACQNSMREFYQAAAGYTDTNDGKFPRVPDGQPASAAAVELQESGYLPHGLQLTCAGAPPGAAVPAALGTYAYTLGFRDESGQLRGMDRSPDSELMPILADAPAREGNAAVPINHRHGQNVLFANGNVRFCTTSKVGLNQDDIFTNKDGFVSAGLSWDDTVLGRPEERP
jgi:hypothetical protein